MLITPQTSVTLLTSVLTEDNENQLTWDSLQAQQDYFEGCPKVSFSDFTYQREQGGIRVPMNIEALRQYNYCFYKNGNFTDKVFYAFITGMQYVNENMTLVFLKTDVYQTWWNDISFGVCFVEREHVNNDGVGLHTYPEGLEYGSYIIDEMVQPQFLNKAACGYCLQVSDFPSASNVTNAPEQVYNGIPSGSYFIVVETAAGVKAWINAYNSVEENKVDAIISIFPLPLKFVADLSDHQLNNSTFSRTFYVPSSQSWVDFYTGNYLEVSRSTKFGSYTPNNNKLYISPYIYFFYDNHAGTTVEYKYEDFVDIPQFDLIGAVNQGGQYRMIPHNLKFTNTSYTDSYGVSIPGLPLGSWNNDAYNNWHALNADGLLIEATGEAVGTTLAAVGNLGTGNLGSFAGSITNLVTSTAQKMNQVSLASKLPNQARGQASTQGLNFARDLSDGTFVKMTIREEYARIIDNFFSLYGYRVNSMKFPNIRGRKRWNYVKTVGANVFGDAPQEALEELKEILNQGCTFWHSPSYILDYIFSDNGII